MISKININNICEVFHIFDNKGKLNKDFFQEKNYETIKNSSNAIEFLKETLKDKK